MKEGDEEEEGVMDEQRRSNRKEGKKKRKASKEPGESGEGEKQEERLALESIDSCTHRAHRLKAHLPRSGASGLIALHLEKKHTFNIQDKDSICIYGRFHTPWDGSQVSKELWAGRS